MKLPSVYLNICVSFCLFFWNDFSLVKILLSSISVGFNVCVFLKLLLFSRAILSYNVYFKDQLSISVAADVVCLLIRQQGCVFQPCKYSCAKDCNVFITK